jgi:hypothetical protein
MTQVASEYEEKQAEINEVRIPPPPLLAYLSTFYPFITLRAYLSTFYPFITRFYYYKRM